MRRQVLDVANLPVLETDKTIEAMPLDDGGVELVDSARRNTDISASEDDWFMNLMDFMTHDELAEVANDILESIENDNNSREDWVQAIKGASDYLGIKQETMKEAWRSGSYSHIFLKSNIDYQSEARVQFLPPDGPTRSEIKGALTAEKELIAKKQEAWGKHFLKEVRRDYYPDTTKMYFYIAFEGCAFKKVYIDPLDELPNSRFIPAHDFIVHQSTKSLEKCPRMTEVIPMTKKEVIQYQLSGYYADVELLSDNDTSDDSFSQISDKLRLIQGFGGDTDEDDDCYEILECHLDYDMPSFEHTTKNGRKTGLPLPYIVTIDYGSRQILRIQRNWRQEDPLYTKIQYYVDFHYLNGLGFYGWGNAHLLCNFMKPSTSLLRQSIDAATMYMFPGGFYAPNFMQFNDNNVTLAPNEYHPVTSQGPISQNLYTHPSKDVSPVILELKKQIDEAGLSLVGSANLPLSDIAANMPVGTVMISLNQANIPKSNVIRNVYDSMMLEFELLTRLFRETLPDNYQFAGKGEDFVISPRDFTEDVKLVPVNDPSISSLAQQQMRSRMLLDTAAQFPQFHKMRNVLDNYYHEMRVPDPDRFLFTEQEMQQMEQMMAEQQANTPPPIDPAAVMLEEVKVKEYGIEKKSESDMLKAQVEAFKAERKAQVEEMKIEEESNLKLLEMKIDQLTAIIERLSPSAVDQNAVQ